MRLMKRDYKSKKMFIFIVLLFVIIQVITIIGMAEETGNTGTGNTGDDTKPEDPKPEEDPKPDDTNTDNSGADNTDTDNSGTDNTDTDNSGTDNSGTDNTDTDNSGADNTDTDNSGADNTDPNTAAGTDTKPYNTVVKLYGYPLIVNIIEPVIGVTKYSEKVLQIEEKTTDGVATYSDNKQAYAITFTPTPPKPKLTIKFLNDALPGRELRTQVTSEGTPIEGVTLKIIDKALTDKNGIANNKIPEIKSGTKVLVTAEKEGFRTNYQWKSIDGKPTGYGAPYLQPLEDLSKWSNIPNTWNSFLKGVLV